MGSTAQGNDLADISARTQRLVARYPETSHAVWITVIVIGFLLIVPVAGGAIFLCASWRVNPLVGLVLGTAAWLGIFLGLRQILFWRRESKVGSFLREFDAGFPAGPDRDSALDYLKQAGAADEDNEVLAVCLRALGATVGTAATKLETSRTFDAGKGLAVGSDPAVDARVELLLEPLDRQLSVLSGLNRVSCVGVPVAVLIAGGVAAPRETGGLAMMFLIAVVVWPVVSSFFTGMIEHAWTAPAVAEFDQAFPEGDVRRGVALASLARRRGDRQSARALREALREEASDRAAEVAQPVQPQVPPTGRAPEASARTAPAAPPLKAAGPSAIPLEPFESSDSKR